MNTPAHAVFNLLLMGRRERPELLLPVAVGAVLPDVPMMVFYAWEKLVLGTPERVIWSQRYYDPGWQTVFDVFNSVPLIAVVWLVAWRLAASRAAALAASMLLHAVADLPLHADDAHRHLWPLSDWRFESPLSYWDPAFGGRWVALAEIAMVLAGSLWLWRRLPSRTGRWLVAATGAIYLGYLAYVLMVWV